MNEENKPIISSGFVKPVYVPDTNVNLDDKEEATAFTHEIFVDDEEKENDDSK